MRPPHPNLTQIESFQVEDLKMMKFLNLTRKSPQIISEILSRVLTQLKRKFYILKLFQTTIFWLNDKTYLHKRADRSLIFLFEEIFDERVFTFKGRSS